MITKNHYNSLRTLLTGKEPCGFSNNQIKILVLNGTLRNLYGSFKNHQEPDTLTVYIQRTTDRVSLTPIEVRWVYSACQQQCYRKHN